MTARRRKTARIQTAAQLRVLASPIAIEILESLQTLGPASVTDLGARLGRTANSLHYHVRKLARVDMVRPVGTRRSGARTQAIYDVVAEGMTGRTAPSDPRLRELTVNAVASVLRQASRDFARASRSSASVERGKQRNILMNRHKAWLSPEALRKVNEHVDAIERIFKENCGTGRGTLAAINLVLTPIRPEGDQA